MRLNRHTPDQSVSPANRGDFCVRKDGAASCRPNILWPILVWPPSVGTFPLGDTAKTRNHTRAGVAARCRPRHGRRVATSRSLHRVTHRAHLEQHVHLIVSLAAGAWSSCQSVAAAMHLRGRSVVHRGRSMSRRQSGRRAAEAAFKHVPRTRLRPARSARRRLACSLPIRSSTT